MSVLAEYNEAIAEMDSCTVSIDPLQYYIYNANTELANLNLQSITVTRTADTFVFPTIPDICIDPVSLSPTSDNIFTLKVDLRLLKVLLWYKNYSDGFVKYASVNSNCLTLLKGIHFLNAVNTSNLTIVEKYIADTVTSDISELSSFIQQKIKLSLYQRFYTILSTLTTDSLYSLINTILYQMGTATQSASAYTAVPFMEGDSLRFYGTITTDIVGKSDFIYGIDIELSTTLTTPDFSMVDGTYESTDTYVMLPMTNGVVSNSLPLTYIVQAYLPVNLSFAQYKSALQTLYPTSVTTFVTSFAQATTYSSMSSTNYVYEMYAISICANIALYYRGFDVSC